MLTLILELKLAEAAELKNALETIIQVAEENKDFKGACILRGVLLKLLNTAKAKQGE